MSTLVRLSKNNDNDIAIITINNPPVNALSPGVPEGIANAIEEINNDPSVEGSGRNWRRPHVHRWRRHQRIWQDDFRQNERPGLLPFLLASKTAASQ